MRLLDQEPMDPDIAEELAAIDATLAGEPVDPRHAELAELALLLRAERPRMRDDLSRSLDARAKQRFARPPAPKWFSRAWVWKPAVSGVAVAATVGMVVVLGSLHIGGSSANSSSASLSAGAALTTSSVTRAAPTQHSLSQTGASVRTPSPALPAAQAAAGAASLAPGGLTVPNSGRRTTQSSQLALTTAPNQIDQVAQELYNVVGAENGIVQSSSVTQTGGLDGSASFQLSIPSSALPATMARLSQLPNSRVASRTDSSQDVTNQFNSVTNRLSEARALRTALLKQLALAQTTDQVNSLKGQIHDADAAIASYQGQLGGLNHKINYSPVAVTIGASAIPSAHGGGGFTIGKSLHTAGRVLTVAAGVALIALAGLAPIVLVVALIWWVAAAMRRRRREHALDLA